MKVRHKLLPNTPRSVRLVAEAGSTVCSVVKAAGIFSDRTLPYIITDIDIEAKSVTLATVTAYAGNKTMFQFDLMFAPCVAKSGVVERDWVRRTLSTRDLVVEYKAAIQKYLSN